MVPVTLDAFFASLDGATPPSGLTDPLRALWHAARGEWDAAHALAQDDPSRAGSWVHAHLHRVEGDLGNAAYWYSRADRPICRDPLDAERRTIVAALLAAA
jgi:hypothetical protein